MTERNGVTALTGGDDVERAASTWGSGAAMPMDLMGRLGRLGPVAMRKDGGACPRERGVDLGVDQNGGAVW